MRDFSHGPCHLTADNKIWGYAFFAQALKVFQLSCFQAADIANKLTDSVSPLKLPAS
jgi:hypothetical protein